jgi:Protein of unknown function (DUF3150)
MENNNNGNNGLLSILTREGVLLKVSVHYWRGCKKLRPEDIGLEKKDLSDQLISLGHKRLLPKDALGTLAVIEGRAHALIEANTFPFLNGLDHFLPNSKLAEVTEKLEELEQEFWEAKKAFLEKYASLRQSASKDWMRMAQKLVKDPERLVATIEASFPYPDQMERYYGFDIQRFQIALPQHMAAELVSASEQQAIIEARQKAAQEAGQKIRNDVQSFVADCVASLREQTAPALRGDVAIDQRLRNGGAPEDSQSPGPVHRSVQIHELCQRYGNGSAVGGCEEGTANQNCRGIQGQRGCQGSIETRPFNVGQSRKATGQVRCH